MKLIQIFSQKGWRRTGAINVAFAFLCAIILLIILSISITRPGASLNRPTIIFQGSCSSSARLNLVLHLLINILSVTVLASSNFFMQVLSSPSREEIDKSHSWLLSLDIGVPSVKNLFHIARFKSTSWLMFLIISAPLHLFFNSAIFSTSYWDFEWQLTLATEAFTKGATFFPPGASLAPAGSAGPGYHWNESYDYYQKPGSHYLPESLINGDNIYRPSDYHYGSFEYGVEGYGETIPLSQYSNKTSLVRRNLSSIAREARSWISLDPKTCRTEYLSCNPRTSYGDVVIIIDNDGAAGWSRSQVFNFDPDTNLTSTWDEIVPPDELNPLWFSAHCANSRNTVRSSCRNTCLGALGLFTSDFNPKDGLSIKDGLSEKEDWSIEFFPGTRSELNSFFGKGVTYNGSLDALQVSGCLAQPATPNCQIGVSNVLLLLVIICVLLKVIQGAITICKLPNQSLVTPGDAIQSFILQPDPSTLGLGTLDIVDSQQLEFGLRRRWTPGDELNLTTTVKPRQWERRKRRIFSVIHHKTWIQTYTVFLAGIGLLLAILVYSLWISTNDFATLTDNANDILWINFGSLNPSYIGILLLVNTPQLIFSACYFSYNAFITRLQVEKEWNSFSQSYQPLRVSYPSGQQTSSYRLQLPYLYGLPLMVTSIIFHWLVSNAVFLFVVDGGYFSRTIYDTGNILFGQPPTRALRDSFHVSDTSFIAIGYSPGFILIIFILASISILLSPIIVSFQWLKGNMIAGGSNSLVISAACHVKNLDASQRHITRTEGSGPGLSECPENQNEVKATADKDLNLAQRKLRWGAMSLPSIQDESATVDGEREIWHLGFGVEEHDITTPKEGCFYI